MAAITLLTIERVPDTLAHIDDLPLTMLVKATSAMMPTKDEKGEYFCESFHHVCDVVFGHKPSFCSNRLKLSWVFVEVFIKSPVPLFVDFNSLDLTTRLDRSALHNAVLGGGVVKHLARFHATTASSRSPRDDHPPNFPHPTSSLTRPNRTH